MRQYILPLSLLLCGCAITPTGISVFDDSQPVHHRLTATHFITPESNGKPLSGRLQLALVGGTFIRSVSDLDSQTYATDPRVQSGIEFMPSLELGVINRFDVFYAEGPGVKIQLMGDSRQDAKTGDFSLALAYTSVMPESSFESEDSTGSIKRAEAEVDGRGDKFQIIFGRRLNDKVLLYGGPFYTKLVIDNVNVFQTNNTNYTVKGDVNSGEGSIFGLNVGVSTETPKSLFNTFGVRLGVEVAYSHTEWEKTFAPAEEAPGKDSVHIGGVFGVSW